MFWTKLRDSDHLAVRVHKFDNNSNQSFREGRTPAYREDIAEFGVMESYNDFYKPLIDPKLGIEALHDKTGKETIPIIETAVRNLMGVAPKQSLQSTQDAAREALMTMLSWARQHPEGIWDVTIS